MEHRILGKTGLQVSRLGLGAAMHGDVYRQDEEVERLLHHALDAGVNFIDTAAMYNRSEERIGRFLASRRDEFFLATKCGVHRAGGRPGAEIVEDYSRDGILRSVEESRSKLCMDVIDLVQFHGLPPVELLDEAFETLLDLKARGRARFVGVSADGPAAAGRRRQADGGTGCGRAGAQVAGRYLAVYLQRPVPGSGRRADAGAEGRGNRDDRETPHLECGVGKGRGARQ